MPAGAATLDAPLTALATILVVIAISLKGGAILRLWAPLIGVAAGTVVAGSLGLYDPTRVGRSSWVGLPEGGWPGVGLDLGPAFVELLPAFVFVALIGAIRTITSAVAIQRVSWRRPRAVDYRAVEGAVAADGIGKLLSGLAGIMPTQTIGVSVPTVELTGVAARRVGIAAGGILVAVAFLPKLLALILAIPSPVIVGLPDRRAGDDLRPRDDGGGPGRDRSSQGDDRRRRVLGRRGLPERPDFPRTP